jgi:acetyl-CoA carboxylase biotin carboxylase subunit
MFRRILVANRGEIALRILRACKSLGIDTVAVVSEADRQAPWVRHAGRSVCIGPAPAEGSYLNAGAILQAAEQTDCQAIHPGYGFLAENALFAARCEQHGLAFIGPRAEGIRRMGDKIEAKRTMAQAGLPTIPGPLSPLRDVDDALRRATEIGYPVLLKAKAGGGGRGMRACETEAELKRGFPEATLEAGKAFGDPSVYLEKLVLGGRHIEFQILCDAYGHGVHLGERECTVQRRHQKLIEESPSPVLDDATRRSVGERVVRAMTAVGYRNAGTVEFLRAPDGALYFMEVNTRLQVEHPVTEMCTGVDLVVEQIKIAAMHPLELRQDRVRSRGHALELRINAEDPDDGFRPDPGVITAFREPPAMIENTRIRWDSAVEQGYRIPSHYDSMVGKLIVHGRDRDSALTGASDALDALRLDGIRTTVPLHRRILSDPRFRSGDYDLNFLVESGLVPAH